MTFYPNAPAPTDNVSTSQGQLQSNNQFLSTTAGNATSGYYELPNGLMLQWGNQQFTSSGTKTVNFPTAFATSCYNVVFSLAFNSSADIVPVCLNNASAFTTTQFQFRVNASPPGADPGQIYWQAIGV